jgi:large subunit ribosomal protein L20
MPRVKGGIVTRRRHKRLLKRVKGYWGQRGRTYRRAKETLQRALRYAFRDRRSRKREFRSLWIQRLNAGCRANGMSYSRFVGGLDKAGIELNRQVLSELALHQPAVFAEVVAAARKALA